MKTEICKCNNCERLLIDENPQVNAEKVEVENMRVHSMVYINDYDNSFWACPHCLTDAYLTDFSGVKKLKTENIMIQDTEKTNIEFYLATYPAEELDEQPTKEVLAVFVDEEKDYRLVSKEIYVDCYSHLCQHTLCSLSFLREKCKKITEKEQYKDLKTELESIGYQLNIL